MRNKSPRRNHPAGLWNLDALLSNILLEGENILVRRTGIRECFQVFARPRPLEQEQAAAAYRPPFPHPQSLSTH